jgi:hypothetical protein
MTRDQRPVVTDLRDLRRVALGGVALAHGLAIYSTLLAVVIADPSTLAF